MANVHVMTIDGNEVAVVMHFAIPATNNLSAVPWQTIAGRFYGKTSLPDGDGTAGTISAAEKTSITAGALVEQTQTFKLGTNAPTGAQIDTAFSAAQSDFVAAFQARYNRYGFTR